MFLDAYELERRLTARERQALPAFMELAWLRGILLWARIAYIDRASDRAEGWIEAYASAALRA